MGGKSEHTEKEHRLVYEEYLLLKKRAGEMDLLEDLAQAYYYKKIARQFSYRPATVRKIINIQCKRYHRERHFGK